MSVFPGYEQTDDKYYLNSLVRKLQAEHGIIEITEDGTYDVDYYDTAEVSVGSVTPTGNINITSTTQTDVSEYATAQVVDADLVAGNIKKDVDILGVVGTYEGGGGGGSDDFAKFLDGSIVSLTTPSGLISMKDTAIASLPNLESVIVQEGVTNIGNQGIYRCLKLKNVELPSTIQSIGNYFCGVLGSEESQTQTLNITCKAITPPTLGTTQPFYNRQTGKLNIYVPSDSVSAYRSADGWSTKSTRIQAIPE